MTNILKVEEIDPVRPSLIAEQFGQVDYEDAFRIELDSPAWSSVDELAECFFRSQPRWISLVSMGLRSDGHLEAELGESAFAVGSAVGSWKVYDRNAGEIVFGDDMGFMEYRFSLARVDSRQATGATAVQYKWARASRFYFRLVKPFHRRFIPIALRNTGLAGSDMRKAAA